MSGRHAAEGGPLDEIHDHIAQTDHNVREMRFQLALQDRRFNEFKEAVMATVDELAGRLSAALDRIETKIAAGDAANSEIESLREQLAQAQSDKDAAAQAADANAVSWAASQFEPLVARIEGIAPAPAPEPEPVEGEQPVEEPHEEFPAA